MIEEETGTKQPQLPQIPPPPDSSQPPQGIEPWDAETPQVTIRDVMHNPNFVKLWAAQMLSQRAEAMQLRYLQTLTQIAGDKSSTIVFPIPMDVLGPLLDKAKDPSR